MLRKFKVLFVVASLAITLSLMSNTYSRYVASSQGNLEIEFAKWQILVNDSDITAQTESSIQFEPVIEANANIATNKIAPSSKGYFDIEIDPTNVDVSFSYTLDLSIDNTNIPDLVITKYVIIPEDYIEGNALKENYLEDNKITNSLYYSNNAFKKFTIRVFFEWIEGTNQTMDDELDTNIGINATTENTTFKINANINFEQII